MEKRNHKKVFGFVFILMAMSAFLTACGGGQEETEAKQEERTEAVAEQQTEEETEKESEAETAEETEASQEPYEYDIEARSALNASGLLTYKFEEEQDADWADNVTEAYIREMIDNPWETPLTEEDKVDLMKVTVGGASIMFDSDLFEVAPGQSKNYEVIMKSAGHDDFRMDYTVENQRAQDFTVRTIDGEGNVVGEKTFSFEEMDEMCTVEDYYSSGCVMHGLNSYRVRGVYLMDLIEAAGFEFTEGMSLAPRVTDVPEKIEVTEVNSSEKTGEVFDNPEKYWMKPRYTDNYKWTYDDLIGRDRYFIKGAWEDEEVNQILVDDAGRFDLDARVALASDESYLEKKDPIIAIQYDELRFDNDPTDIREYESPQWELSQEETAFRFLMGVPLDDDTSVNLLAFDDEQQIYPTEEDPSKAGLVAVEEGVDACGTAARSSRNTMGIDIFLDGGTN